MKFTLPTQTQQEILKGIGSQKHTWEYRFASLTTITQTAVGLAVMMWFWKRLPPAVPLWYSMPWGEDRLASPWLLLLPIAAAIIIYGINLLLVIRVGVRHPMFARVLFLAGGLVSTLSLVIVVRIVTLVS